jgi:translation elongation factor EF-G
MAAEHMVQAQLHRLGIHCGPVDGIIGDRTIASIKALGLGGLPMERVVEALVKMHSPNPFDAPERRAGQIVVGGNVEAFSSGHVHTTRTNTGYAMTIDGPGRVTLLIGE